MGTGLQAISTSIHGLMTQADVAVPEGADSLTQLMDWVNRVPGMGWAVAGFGFIALAVAAIAKLTGNLDKILSFFGKYFGKAEVALTEPELSMLRQNLLKQMTTDVALRLNDSLHNLVRIDLEREEQLYQIGRRKDRLIKPETKRTQPFADLISRGLAIFNNNKDIKIVTPAERTYTIFHRPDIRGRLLILGEPGAGKTTELLTVAQRLIEEATKDDKKPIPILFELSSWTPSTPILIWLGQQLSQIYGVSKRLTAPLARQWIQQTQILPLLDGLDELGQRDQTACIDALDAFLAQHPALSIIVCCRKEEYELGGQKFQQMKGAIYLQSITPHKVKQYLKALDRQSLWKNISDSPELLELTCVPLFLTMLVVAYQGQPIRDTATLFDAYIQKQLHDVSHLGTYKPGKDKTPQKTLHYLRWLALQLEIRQKTEFFIEDLHSNILPSAIRRLVYELFIGTITGFICGVILAIIFSTAFGILFGLFAWLIYLIFDSPENLTSYLNSGIAVGFMISALVGPGAGLLIGITGSGIKPTEKIRWQFRKGVRIGLRTGLRTGLINGLIIGLVGGLAAGASIGVSAGIVTVIISGLLAGFTSSISRDQVQEKTIPNQGIWKSIQNALLGGAIVGSVMGIVGAIAGGITFSLLPPTVFTSDSLVIETWSLLDAAVGGAMLCGVVSAVSTGLLFGLIFGFNAAGQHFALRILLAQSGLIPWNYARFLEHTGKHRFTQRTGGRYRFIHDLLREHFAKMTPQQQDKLSQPHRHKGSWL